MHPVIAPAPDTATAHWWHCYTGSPPWAHREQARIFIGPSPVPPGTPGLSEPLEWYELFEVQRVMNFEWLATFPPSTGRLIVTNNGAPRHRNAGAHTWDTARQGNASAGERGKGRGHFLPYLRSWAVDAGAELDRNLLVVDTHHVLTRPQQRGRQLLYRVEVTGCPTEPSAIDGARPTA